MTEPQRDDPATTIVKAIRDQVWLRDVDPAGNRGETAWDLLAHAARDAAAALAESRALRLELQALRTVIEVLAVARDEPVDVDALLAGVDDALASTRAGIRDARTG